jgi:hypothetical protein
LAGAQLGMETNLIVKLGQALAAMKEEADATNNIGGRHGRPQAG